MKNEEKELEQFRLDALYSHNKYRQLHGSQPLQHCRVLSWYAQKWAEKIAKDAEISHSTAEWRKKYNGVMLGENIVATNGFILTGKGLSDMWYSESFKHIYEMELQQETKSFTQMVWNNSRQVGFGRAKGKDEEWYGVALYHPFGNISGHFKKNVRERLQPLDQK